MPEGDTILRTARTLERALAGKTVTKFASAFPKLLRVDDQTPLRGRTIERVTASGKHLMIAFSGGLTLRTHMRMNGSWHIYRSGERWKRPYGEMRIVLATDDYEAVGFNVPVAEFMTSSDVIDALGPDILKDDFDPAEAIRRMRMHGEEEIANALLNQRVVAGIGNIYKSDSLFAARVNPFERVSTLDDAAIGRVLKHARSIMRRAANGPRDRYAVYERTGEPCRKCGSRIEFRRQGRDARGTYWCPRCQGRIAAHAD